MNAKTETDGKELPKTRTRCIYFTGEPGDDNEKRYRSILGERGGEHVHASAHGGDFVGT